MTNAETLKLYKKHFDRWKYMVKAYGWHITIFYYDAYDDMPEEFGDPNTAAGTKANFKYLDAAIHVNLKRSSSLDEEEIENVCIHELIHLLVSPLQESSEVTPLEYTVTTLSRIMQGLRDQGTLDAEIIAAKQKKAGKHARK